MPSDQVSAVPGRPNSAAADPVTTLAHRIIRAGAGDASEPFMIEGHPLIPHREGHLVRACFYYAVVIGPRVAILYDNFGRGGMCDMHPDEIVAIWHTRDLLSALGTSFECLLAGNTTLSSAPIPEPTLNQAALDALWRAAEQIDA